MIAFRKLQEQDFESIARMQARTEYNGSEYSLLYLSGWPFFRFSDMEIGETQDCIYLRFTPNHPSTYDPQKCTGDYLYLPPLCEQEAFARNVEALRDDCRANGKCMYIINVPEAYAKTLDAGQFELRHNRDYDEYLYDPQALMTLSGKKYHAKRNFANRFIRAYMDPLASVVTMREYRDTDADGVRALFAQWQQTKTFASKYRQSEEQETQFLQRALELLDGKTYFADVMETDGKLIGFSYGEITPSGVGIVHIEKADTEYDGIYAALNMLFARRHFGEVRYINRQEDMGLEGLRQAKESYRPVAFAEKYGVIACGCKPCVDASEL